MRQYFLKLLLLADEPHDGHWSSSGKWPRHGVWMCALAHHVWTMCFAQNFGSVILMSFKKGINHWRSLYNCGCFSGYHVMPLYPFSSCLSSFPEAHTIGFEMLAQGPTVGWMPQNSLAFRSHSQDKPTYHDGRERGDPDVWSNIILRWIFESTD